MKKIILTVSLALLGACSLVEDNSSDNVQALSSSVQGLSSSSLVVAGSSTAFSSMKQSSSSLDLVLSSSSAQVNLSSSSFVQYSSVASGSIIAATVISVDQIVYCYEYAGSKKADFETELMKASEFAQVKIIAECPKTELVGNCSNFTVQYDSVSTEQSLLLGEKMSLFLSASPGADSSDVNSLVSDIKVDCPSQGGIWVGR